MIPILKKSSGIISEEVGEANNASVLAVALDIPVIVAAAVKRPLFIFHIIVFRFFQAQHMTEYPCDRIVAFSYKSVISLCNLTVTLPLSLSTLTIAPFTAPSLSFTDTLYE